MAELTGRVITPGDPGWDSARRGFNTRIDYDAATPQAIVFGQGAYDVANAVRWARERRVPLSVRSGRHNYEGYSSLARGGVIIDVSEIDGVRMDGPEGMAVVGAGIDMLRFVETLWEKGVTVPAATGPSVGLAGLALGGGFGITSRKFGLTCDSLVNVELVDARGEVLNASEHEHPELFWACRGGGGGNFGIVTSLAFQAQRVGLVAAFNISWTWDQFDQIVSLWQSWAPDVDDGVTSLLRLTVDRQVTLIGQYTADASDLPRLSGLLAPMMSAAAPTSVSIQVAPFIVAARMFFGVDPLNPLWAVQTHGDREIYKSTSALAYEPFTPDAIRTLREHLEAVPPLSAPPPEPSMVQLLGGGGAPSRIAPDATAAVHRQARFIVQYNSFWTAPQDAQKTIDWVVGFRRAMLPYTRGAYVNYHDSTIADWPRAYYGSNLERLVRVKKRYDPDNVFSFPQSIPTSL